MGRDVGVGDGRATARLYARRIGIHRTPMPRSNAVRLQYCIPRLGLCWRAVGRQTRHEILTVQGSLPSLPRASAQHTHRDVPLFPHKHVSEASKADRAAKKLGDWGVTVFVSSAPTVALNCPPLPSNLRPLPCHTVASPKSYHMLSLFNDITRGDEP